jgi:hypothetical protein
MIDSEFEKTERNIYPKACLCDSRVSSITFEKAGVLFRFPQGIAVEEPVDRSIDQRAYFRTKEAAVLINECSTDDLRCRIITRFCVFGNVFYIGRDLEPKQLIRQMRKHQLEVIDELYSYKYLFWRCEMLPYKRSRTCIEIEISIYNVDEITYCWNDEQSGKKVAFN